MTQPHTSTLLGQDERGSEGGRVRRTVLPGGLRVLTESIPTVRSVTIGMWVGVGSVDEHTTQAGATHYLEHLLFKGTAQRSAMGISSTIEAVGGEMNAFTAKEYTCYYARVIDTHLPVAVDVLGDMLTSSSIEQADVDAERDVVLEEISMRDDDPADLAQELSAEAMWGDAPLGRSILGTVDSITSMSRQVVVDYYRGRYRPPHIVVSASGNVDHDTVVGLVEQAFAEHLADGAQPVPARLGGEAPVAGAGVELLERPTEQGHLVWSVPGLARNDPRRFALSVLNAAVGGGMSSRLFQEIREKRGLSYAVFSYSAQYAPAGMLNVYAGCNPAKAGEVLGLIDDVLADVVGSGITATELERAKGLVSGSLVLGLEDTSARMARLAKAELVYDELHAVSDILARIEAVTLDDVAELAKLWSSTPSLAVVGPFQDTEPFEAVLR